MANQGFLAVKPAWAAIESGVMEIVLHCALTPVAQVLDGLAPIMAGNVRSALGMANLPVPAALQDVQPSAAALLRVALQEIAAGVSVLHDPNALSPVYVRNKVAKTTAERAAQTQR